MDAFERLRERKEKRREENKFRELLGIKLGTFELSKLIIKIIAIVCIIGMALMTGMIYYAGHESYSGIYISPGSYSNYVENNTISFTYGVKSFETNDTEYKLNVFLGDGLIKKKEFRLNAGEKLEENMSIIVPDDIEFPAKVKIIVIMNDKEESVHFWLKGKM